MRRTIGLIGYSTFETSKLNIIQKALPFDIQIIYISIKTTHDVRGILFDDVAGTISDKRELENIYKTLEHNLKSNIKKDSNSL